MQEVGEPERHHRESEASARHGRVGKPKKGHRVQLAHNGLGGPGPLIVLCHWQARSLSSRGTRGTSRSLAKSFPLASQLTSSWSLRKTA